MIVEHSYLTSKFISYATIIIGWSTTVVGIVLTVGVSAVGSPLVGLPAFVVAIMGLSAVAAGQISLAVIHTAENTAKIAILLQKRPPDRADPQNYSISPPKRIFGKAVRVEPPITASL